jgi:hypothetical protein
MPPVNQPARLGGRSRVRPDPMGALVSRVPVEVSLMLQGAILLFAIGGEIFARYRLSVTRPSEAVSS